MGDLNQKGKEREPEESVAGEKATEGLGGSSQAKRKRKSLRRKVRESSPLSL